MLNVYLCRLFATFAHQKKPTSPLNPVPLSKTTLAFSIKLAKINDPSYFMTIINNHHSLTETNRMIKSIVDGKTPLNPQNFSTIFKKYSYYIENVPSSPTFDQTSLDERIKFLKGVTTIYAKMGQLASVRMLKCFNKLADELFKHLVGELEHAKDGEISPLVENSILVILSVGKYNKKKSFAMMKAVEKYFKNSRFLLGLSEESALYYLEACNLLSYYNRLVFEMCLDALKDRISDLSAREFQNVLYSVGKSQYPINHFHATLFLERVVREFRKKVDTTTGQPFPPTVNSVRHSIRMLQSLSLIEVNMKLASSYLPEFTELLQIEIFDISAQLSIMNDKDLRDYANLLRRACYYDENILLRFATQLTQREVNQLRQFDFTQSDNQSKSHPHLSMTMDTFASCMHTLAVCNFRHPPVINYFIKSAHLLYKMKKLKKQTDSQGMQSEQNIFHPKHYGRVMWSMCVLCTRQQLVEIYPILEKFFAAKLSNSLYFYDTLNFYYCYLLLKTCFPMNRDRFDVLLENLQQQQLATQISETHQALYRTFIQAGIPALKEHNLSNLMCDVFIPTYQTTDSTYSVVNVVIDLHGHHHFMRNCQQLKGGNALKAKILASEGYIYQYIGVEEWGLADDKQAFVVMLMDNIARKFGEKQAPKTTLDPVSVTSTTIVENKANAQQSPTKPIQMQGRRRVKTNSRSLQAKLNQGSMGQNSGNI